MANQLHMQATPIETYATVTRPGGTELMTQGQYSHYGYVGSNNQWVQPVRTDRLLLTPGVTKAQFSPAAVSGTSLQLDGRYDSQTYLTYEPASGNLQSQQQADAPIASYQWGYAPPTATGQPQLVTASFVNAARTSPNPASPALGNEASYLGFEHNQQVDNDPGHDYWRNLDVNTTNGSFTTDAHTGSGAWRLGPGAAGPNYGPTRNFQPSRQALRYRLSAWVKTDAGTAGTVTLALAAQDAGGAPLWCAGCFKEQSSGTTNGQWTYVETLLDLNAVHTQAGIPISTAAAAQLRLVAYVYNTSNTAVSVDDLRFQPADAQVTTYTYDATTRQPTSISGPDSRPAYYDYDGLQRLRLVRDHQRNIVKRYGYHFMQ